MRACQPKFESKELGQKWQTALVKDAAEGTSRHGSPSLHTVELIPPVFASPARLDQRIDGRTGRTTGIPWARFGARLSSPGWTTVRSGFELHGTTPAPAPPGTTTNQRIQNEDGNISTFKIQQQKPVPEPQPPRRRQ